MLLYDGVCGLCNRVVQFTLARDPAGNFRFAALESPIAARILRRHGIDPIANNSLVVVLDLDLPGEKLLFRSDGALYLLQRLRAPWHILSRTAKLLPRAFRDVVYQFIAAHRYRVFGKYDVCPLPTAALRSRFLDMQPEIPESRSF